MATHGIGTSGFSYQHWKGAFYPAGVSQARWLEYYAAYFATVELNVTFYRLPSEAAVASWARRVPEDFVYAVKLSRTITHLKRLADSADLLTRFLMRMAPLGHRLGPILVQLPPQMPCNVPRLEEFLAQCDPALRWAVEFRHPSWLTEETFAVLARYHIALCIHDLLAEHPRVVTAPFVYLRFHGSGVKYGGSYPDTILQQWAAVIRAWEKDDRDVYAYFNNDQHAYAVANALTLRRLLDAP